MNRRLVSKTLSLVLMLAVLLPAASCGMNNSGKTVRKIAAEDPWFDAKVYDIEPDLDEGGKEINYKTQWLAGADDKYIVVFSQGSYIRPENNEVYSEIDYRYFLATVIDRNSGAKVNTIDYGQYLSGNGYIQDVKYFNGKITSTVYKEDERGGYAVEMDNEVLSGEKLAERELSNSYSSFGEKDLFRIGKYTILSEGVYGEINGSIEFYNLLTIYSSNGEKCSVKLKKDRIDLNSTSVILPIDEDRLLVPFTQTSDNVPVFFEVDVKTGKAAEVDGKDYDWIDFKRITNVFGGKDGQVYFTNSVGISKIDMKNKKIEEFFSYNACQVNKELLNSAEVVDCSDDSVVLVESRSSYNPYYFDEPTAGFNVYYFTKSSSNPHAGKTVLELYATNGYVDQIIGEAIIKFNETNSDYYIEVTGRYTDNGVYTYLQSDSQDDAASIRLQTDMSLNDKLAMDIMNGVGPDILIISGDMGRLYNSNNLADLSKYLGDLDPEKYFTNVVDAAKTDGKLFQLPVVFDIEGIHTDIGYAGASGVGFTTKEYEDFLYGPLNGYDLDQAGQAFYFATLFNAMKDKFIVNGKVDFSGPEFAALATFVKENVREKAPSMDSYELSDDKRYQNNRIARLTTYNSITDYLAGVNDLQGSRALLGLPSADGRGPMIKADRSVAVSAQSVNIDACAEFAKLLISDDIQYELAKTNRFTVSREAYKKVTGLVIDFCNSPKANNEFGYDHVTFEPITYRLKFAESDLTYLEKIISSCTHFDSADASINMILIEEMPAYFLGQKDLDSVIRIAQDRAQKVLDER